MVATICPVISNVCLWNVLLLLDLFLICFFSSFRVEESSSSVGDWFHSAVDITCYTWPTFFSRKSRENISWWVVSTRMVLWTRALAHPLLLQSAVFEWRWVELIEHFFPSAGRMDVQRTPLCSTDWLTGNHFLLLIEESQLGVHSWRIFLPNCLASVFLSFNL